MNDGALFQLGLFSFGAHVTSQNSSSFVLLSGSVATLFASQLAFLRSRYLLALQWFDGPDMKLVFAARIWQVLRYQIQFVILWWWRGWSVPPFWAFP